MLRLINIVGVVLLVSCSPDITSGKSLDKQSMRTVIYEHDSDGNTMVTTLLVASFHPMPRMDVRAEGYLKQLEQTFGAGALEVTARGVTVSGRYQIQPGWTLSGGIGGSRSDGTGDPSLLEYRIGVRSPNRHRVGASVKFVSAGLLETAALAELGVRST